MQSLIDETAQLENCRWTADVQRGLHNLDLDDLAQLVAMGEVAGADPYMTNTLKLVLFAAEQYRELGLRAEFQRRMDELKK